MQLSQLWQSYISSSHTHTIKSTLPPSIHIGHDPVITAITHDSRQVCKGSLYIALAGRNTHGIEYVTQAIAAGASALAIDCEQVLPTDFPHDFPYIRLAHPRIDMAYLSDVIYQQAQTSLTLVGLTGTNGKTTTSSLLAGMIKQYHGDVGLLGTVFTSGAGIQKSSTLTTMESPALHQHFQTLVQAGVKHCVMEVSSIGLAESRVAACRFDRAAFLNLSEDHLDYHQTMSAYAEAKLSLFTQHLADDAHIFINVDDAFGIQLIDHLQKHKSSQQKLWTYALHAHSILAPTRTFTSSSSNHVDIYWQTLTHHPDGLQGTLHTPWGTIPIHSHLLGEFNAYNLALACSIACSLELNVDHIQQGIHSTQVPGRMQWVDPSFHASILVDYAHSPDALQRALQALRPYCQGHLYCLFGCGGDRDTSKRALMGQAASHADMVILTNDNPRFEDEWTIALHALQGLEEKGYHRAPHIQKGSTWIELDRAKAIQTSIESLQAGDVLLIAGKGHESYQEIAGHKYPFSDVTHAQKVIHQVVHANQS